MAPVLLLGKLCLCWLPLLVSKRSLNGEIDLRLNVLTLANHLTHCELLTAKSSSGSTNMVQCRKSESNKARWQCFANFMPKSEVSKETLKPFQADSPTNAILEVEFSNRIDYIPFHVNRVKSQLSSWWCFHNPFLTNVL